MLRNLFGRGPMAVSRAVLLGVLVVSGCSMERVTEPISATTTTMPAAAPSASAPSFRTTDSSTTATTRDRVPKGTAGVEFTLTGKVSATPSCPRGPACEKGYALTNVKVQLSGNQGVPEYATRTDSSGRYKLRAVPGSYEIVVVPNPTSGTMCGPVPLMLIRDVTVDVVCNSGII